MKYQIIAGAVLLTTVIATYFVAPSLHHRYRIWQAEDQRSAIAQLDFTIPASTSQPQVSTPQPHTSITSPLSVRGTAPQNWFFEATAGIRLLDADRNIIAEKWVTAADWISSAQPEFKGEITFAPPASATGWLVLRSQNASGLPEHNRSFEIPINFATLDATAQFWQRVRATTPPPRALLDVPFICQNPFRDAAGWKTHKESCEEAAALQAKLFIDDAQLTPQQAHEAIVAMIAAQQEQLGEHRDLYGQEFRQFLLDYWSLPPERIVHIPALSRELAQQIIAAGHPIIVPIRGELLKNPFYPHPGYHMLTIVGYTATQFVTNDVGTKRGEHYPYDFARLLGANAPVGGDALVILPAGTN